ncbi:hypothetical protein [Streptomyces nigrescens]|uniref:hypothetical protein n=1 Tax=Streptomyces nigrescens TaxID=1920 RepID=UPI0037012710
MPETSTPAAQTPHHPTNPHVSITLARAELGALLRETWRTLGWEAPYGAHVALGTLRAAYLGSSTSAATLTVQLDHTDLGALLKEIWHTVGRANPLGALDALTALDALRAAYLHPHHTTP